MIDINAGCKPYKKGDRLILEIIVNDEDKSFDFLGKALRNKFNMEELGFNIDKVCFWKDRYIDNIPIELRSEIADKLQKALDEIRGLIIVVQDTAWLLGTGRSQTEVFFGFGGFPCLAESHAHKVMNLIVRYVWQLTFTQIFRVSEGRIQKLQRSFRISRGQLIFCQMDQRISILGAYFSFSSSTSGHDHFPGSGEEEAGCGCRRRF